FGAKPFVFIRVHSWLAFRRATQRSGDAVHHRYRQEASRCWRFLRVKLGGNVDASGRTLASPRSLSSRILVRWQLAKHDPVRLRGISATGQTIPQTRDRPQDTSPQVLPAPDEDR